MFAPILARPATSACRFHEKAPSRQDGRAMADDISRTSSVSGKLMTILKSLLLKSLYYFQAPRLMRYLLRNKAVILMYHGFTNKKRHEGIENYDGKHCNITNFRKHLEFLTKEYNVISLQQLVDYYRLGTKLPKNAVVITMDDGLESNYSLAFPELKRFNIPVTIFLTTNFIDNDRLLPMDRVEYIVNRAKIGLGLSIGDEKFTMALADRQSKEDFVTTIKLKLKSERHEVAEQAIEGFDDPDNDMAADEMPAIYRPLRWKQIQEMLRSGMISFGSHTCSHPILTKCDPARMNAELELSKSAIEEQTGVECTLFGYPNGDVGSFDENTKRALITAGYTCGTTTVDGFNDKRSDVFKLRRMGVSNGYSFIEFVMVMCGIIPTLRNIKRKLLRREKGQGL